MPAGLPRRGIDESGRLNQHTVLKWLNGAILAGLVIYIVIPPAMTLLMSFNDLSFVRFPIKAASLRWYGEFLAREEWAWATVNSLQIATAVSAIATTVGVLGAYAYVFAPMRWRVSYYLLITLPLYVPGAVLGLGISVMFGGLSLFGYSLYGAKVLIIPAHCMWALPLAFMICVEALRNVDMSVIEAAADLGASPLRSFFTVTLPPIEIGVVSSAILSFVISLNEFPMGVVPEQRRHAHPARHDVGVNALGGDAGAGRRIRRPGKRRRDRAWNHYLAPQGSPAKGRERSRVADFRPTTGLRRMSDLSQKTRD